LHFLSRRYLCRNSAFRLEHPRENNRFRHIATRAQQAISNQEAAFVLVSTLNLDFNFRVDLSGIPCESKRYKSIGQNEDTMVQDGIRSLELETSRDVYIIIS